MERILVIEEDSFFSDMFSSLLAEEGYDVDIVSSGEEALERIAKGTYRVVVTDLELPGMGGLDVLARVKQLDSAIEVIVVTSHANVDTAIYALKNGARDYLVKPINHEEFKHSVGTCVEQRRLLDENQELKALVDLFQTSQTIANCLDLDRITKLVMDALAKVTGAGRALGFSMDEEGCLSLKEIRGVEEEVARGLSEYIIASRQSYAEKPENFFFIADFPTSLENALISKNDLKQLLLVLLRSKNGFHGMVALFNDRGKEFPPGLNCRHLSFLIDQSSLAFENAARYTAARKLLNIDELTGLFNYRYLETALEREIKRAERYGSTLSVIFLDIDQFKEVNDTYGHLIGSRVLKEVGLLLKKLVREVDTVIRYGGDEYTIILVESNKSGAASVAERIRKAIQGHGFLLSEGYNIKITVSLGYACYPDDSHSKTELLELADQAMYKGKYSGKNVVFHIRQDGIE